MDSTQIVNAPREVTLAGAVYPVSALTLAEWGRVQAYLKDHAVNPVVAALETLAAARKAGVDVDPADRKALLDDARAEGKAWPPRVGTAAWFSLLEDTEGATLRFLAAVLGKHTPGLTDADLTRVSDAATGEESRLLIYRALGVDPDPKAGEGEAAGPAPSPTTGTPPPTP